MMKDNRAMLESNPVNNNHSGYTNGGACIGSPFLFVGKQKKHLKGKPKIAYNLKHIGQPQIVKKLIAG